MNDPSPATAISPLRQRLTDDMNVRRFSRETQRNYFRDVGRFATFLGRSPGTATANDVRRFQIEQRDAGVPTPTMNSIVSALRFFFTHTIDRPDLARKAIRVAHPRNLPVVLNRDDRTLRVRSSGTSDDKRHPKLFTRAEWQVRSVRGRKPAVRLASGDWPLSTQPRRS
jgi:site-specific recombinase XerD